MATPPETTHDPDLIAVSHLAGDQWRCLLARRGPRGPQIQELTTFPADDALAAEAWSMATGAETRLSVIPAAEIICKAVSLPDVDTATALGALQLQAEAMGSPTLPPHRQAIIPLASDNGHGHRAGLLMGWPTTSTWRGLGTDDDTQLVPDVAAMAAILGSTRPAEAMAWIDPATQSVALAMTTPGGVAIRATREAATSSTTAVTQIITETGLAGNHTPTYIDNAVAQVTAAIEASPTGDAVFVIPVETADAVAVAADATDQAWWNLWGIPLGAALIACRAEASASTVTAEAPIEVPSLLGSITHRLSSPTMAKRLGFVAVLAIVLGPLMASGARLGLLTVMNPDLDTQIEELRRIETQQVLYRHLERENWSMTKLLGDIAAATPEGIELFRIDLTPASNRIRLSGEAIKHGDASSREVIARMQELMADAGIFGQDIQPNIEQREYVKRAFTINASASRPHLRPAYSVDQDFSRWTLADRRAGIDPPEEGGSISQEDRDALPPIPGGTTTRTTTTSDDTDTSPSTADPDDNQPTMAELAAAQRADRSTTGAGGDLASRGAGDRGGVGGTQTAIVPEPRSDEVIAMMTVPQLREALAEIAAALKTRDVKEDADVKKRLNAEMREVFKVLREKEE